MPQTEMAAEETAEPDLVKLIRKVVDTIVPEG